MAFVRAMVRFVPASVAAASVGCVLGYDPLRRYPVLPDLPNADVVVLGAGTAGNVFAYYLGMSMPKTHVLVLDAGAGNENSNPYMSGWDQAWGSFSQALAAFDHQGNPYPVTPSYCLTRRGAEGHNTAIAFTLGDEQWGLWAKARATSEEELKIATQVVLNHKPLMPAVKHGDAPWFDAAFKALQERAGMRRTPGPDFGARILPNTVGVVSMAAYPDGKDALRWHSGLLMTDRLRPSNVSMLHDVKAKRLVWSDESGSVLYRWWARITEKPLHASAVIVEQGGCEYRVPLKSNQQLVLSMGALSMPAFLLRSGVGPKDVLRDAGIEQRINSPQVGRGFDHPEYAVRGDLAPGVDVYAGSTGWAAVLYMIAHPDAKKQSPTQAHFSIAGFPYTDGEPCAIITPNLSSPDTLHGYQIRLKGDKGEKGMTVHYFEKTDEDKAAVRHGLREAYRLMQVLKDAGLITNVRKPPEAVIGNDPKLDECAQETEGTAFHFMGDARASSDPRSVFDAQGRLRNGRGVISNVWGISAATFHDAPWGNLHVSVQMLAVLTARSVQRVLGDRGDSAAWVKAAQDLKDNGGELTIRRPGEEMPPARYLAEWDARQWRQGADGNDGPSAPSVLKQPQPWGLDMVYHFLRSLVV